MGDKRKTGHEIWTTEPAEDDFPAAQAYLTLLMGLDAARRVVEALRATGDYPPQGQGPVARESAATLGQGRRGGRVEFEEDQAPRAAVARAPAPRRLGRHLGNPRPVALSRAALEVLAIIAHRQPIARAGFELIRGSASDSALDTLLERGLIERNAHQLLGSGANLVQS